MSSPRTIAVTRSSGGRTAVRITDSVLMHNVIATDYAEMLESPSNQRQAREVSEVLPVRDGDTVLDVGAGVGRVARVILEKHQIKTYYALEPSKLALHFRVRSPRLKLIRERGQCIPLPDDTCDLAFAEQVLIHIKAREEQAKILREMQRVTKPGGFVCLTTTQCYGSLMTSYSDLLNRREIHFKAGPKSEDGGDVYCYRRRFSVDEMKGLLTESKLKLRRMIPRERANGRSYSVLPVIFRLLRIYDHVIAQVPKATPG